MHIRSMLRFRRLGPLTALAMFAVLLSACSPGAIVVHTSGSTKNVADSFSEQVFCGQTIPVSLGNCRGQVTGVIDGLRFYSLGQSGGTALYSDYGDCLQVPCGPDGASEIKGNAVWGSSQISFEVTAYDNGPGATDNVYLYSPTIPAFTRQFTCAGCVHVVVLPGTIPGT